MIFQIWQTINDVWNQFNMQYTPAMLLKGAAQSAIAGGADMDFAQKLTFAQLITQNLFNYEQYSGTDSDTDFDTIIDAIMVPEPVDQPVPVEASGDDD